MKWLSVGEFAGRRTSRNLLIIWKKSDMVWFLQDKVDQRVKLRFGHLLISVELVRQALLALRHRHHRSNVAEVLIIFVDGQIIVVGHSSN